jgi:hypothetical protein
LQVALRQGLASGELALSANQAITTAVCALPGAALVGDAGGCSHPLTATGMTCALHDIGELLRSLDAEGLTDAALLGYQRRRYRYVRAREFFAQALYNVLRGAGPETRVMRQAVFEYWSRPRARRASMAILSGEHSDWLPFVSEYSRVVARSGWLALASAPEPGPHPPVGEVLAGLAREVQSNAARAWTQMVQTVSAEATLKLPPLKTAH